MRADPRERCIGWARERRARLRRARNPSVSCATSPDESPASPLPGSDCHRNDSTLLRTTESRVRATRCCTDPASRNRRDRAGNGVPNWQHGRAMVDDYRCVLLRLDDRLRRSNLSPETCGARRCSADGRASLARTLPARHRNRVHALAKVECEGNHVRCRFHDRQSDGRALAGCEFVLRRRGAQVLACGERARADHAAV